MNKPCVIVYSKTHLRYEAFNEDGRLLAYHYMTYHLLSLMVESMDYEPIPLNSRLGRTILDKINQHSV